MKIETIVVGQLGVNCYLLIDEATRAAVVIDPGDDPHRIEGLICDEDVDMKYFLLTHGHPDHSFAVGELQERFHGVDLLMHQADVPQIGGEPEIVAMYFDVTDYVEPQLGRFLIDRDIVQFGQSSLTVVHTPGHTPGGLCYVSGTVAFTGDTLFADAVGRTDLMGGSHEELMRSIKDRLLTLPDDTVIYPGHGPTSTIRDERVGNPFLS